jgi:hypothetical protein
MSEPSGQVSELLQQWITGTSKPSVRLHLEMSRAASP